MVAWGHGEWCDGGIIKEHKETLGICRHVYYLDCNDSLMKIYICQKLIKRGKRYGDICICIADSLCYKAETNTTL